MYMDTLYHTYILYYTYLVAQLDIIIYHRLALDYWPAPVLTQSYSGLAVTLKPVQPTDNIYYYSISRNKNYKYLVAYY